MGVFCRDMRAMGSGRRLVLLTVPVCLRWWRIFVDIARYPEVVVSVLIQRRRGITCITPVLTVQRGGFFGSS